MDRNLNNTDARLIVIGGLYRHEKSAVGSSGAETAEVLVFAELQVDSPLIDDGRADFADRCSE